MKSPSWIKSPTSSPMETIRVADVLAVSSGTSNANNSVLLTLGNAVSGEIYTTQAILYNSPGIYSVPLPSGTIDNQGNYTATNVSPTACQAVCYVQNSNWVVMQVRDTRGQTNQGNIQPGEIALQVLGAQARIILKQDSSINLYTLNNGSSMGLFIAPNEDTISCINSKGYGFQITDVGVNIFASTSAPAGGSLSLKTDGNTSLLGTKVTQIDGANIVLGSNPALNPITNAICINPTAIVLALTTVATALTAIPSAFTPSPGGAAQLTAAAAAAAALTEQVASLLLLIQSKKVTSE